MSGSGLVATIAWSDRPAPPSARGQHPLHRATMVVAGRAARPHSRRSGRSWPQRARADATASTSCRRSPASARPGGTPGAGLSPGSTLGTTAGPPRPGRGGIHRLPGRGRLAAGDRAAATRRRRSSPTAAPARNDWLMQLQADVSRRARRAPMAPQLSALGAAHLARQAVGVWAADGQRAATLQAGVHARPERCGHGARLTGAAGDPSGPSRTGTLKRPTCRPTNRRWPQLQEETIMTHLRLRRRHLALRHLRRPLRHRRLRRAAHASSTRSTWPARSRDLSVVDLNYPFFGGEFTNDAGQGGARPQQARRHRHHAGDLHARLRQGRLHQSRSRRPPARP